MLLLKVNFQSSEGFRQRFGALLENLNFIQDGQDRSLKIIKQVLICYFFVTKFIYVITQYSKI